MLLLFDVTEYYSRLRLSNKSSAVFLDFDATPNISMSGASVLSNMLSSSNRPPLFESTLVVLSLDDTAARKSVLFCDLEPELAAEKSSSPESESSKSSEIFNFGARFKSAWWATAVAQRGCRSRTRRPVTTTSYLAAPVVIAVATGYCYCCYRSSGWQSVFVP